MWKLNLPDNMNAISEIDTAFTYVNGKSKFSITSLERNQVKIIYELYEKRKGIGNISLLGSSLRPELLDAMVEAYNEVQQAGRLKNLRNRLMLNIKCPSCGILPVDELDHYLPKSVYKVLSIYSSNIVPYCHTCNKHKLSANGDDDHKRFVHSYYENIPEDLQFLGAKVWIEGKGLQCELFIKKATGLDPNLYERLKNQISTVRLTQRVTNELFDFLSSLDFEAVYQSGGKDAVILLLKSTSKRFYITYGLNHWRPLIVESLSECDQFCTGGFKECLSTLH